jgi:hypothetical protein
MSDRVVAPVVSELHLESGPPKSLAQQLMAHADPEHGNLSEQIPAGLSR